MRNRHGKQREKKNKHKKNPWLFFNTYFECEMKEKMSQQYIISIPGDF